MGMGIQDTLNRMAAEHAVPTARAMFYVADIKQLARQLEGVKKLHTPYKRVVHTDTGTREELTCPTCQWPHPCETFQQVTTTKP